MTITTNTLTTIRPLKLFEELDEWNSLFPFPRFLPTSYNVPSIDVEETDKNILIKADLPGLDKKDITISLEDNILSIKGEKKEEKVEKSKTYLRSERFCGSFVRDIPIHAEIDTEKIDAKYNNGVLELSLPKKDIKQIKAKTVEIK